MYLYLLQNQITGNYYIGVSKNVEERLKYHNSNNKHYSGKIRGDWKLLATKYFELDREARSEEIRLKKSKNRNYIKWYFQVSEGA